MYIYFNKRIYSFIYKYIYNNYHNYPNFIFKKNVSQKKKKKKWSKKNHIKLFPKDKIWFAWGKLRVAFSCVMYTNFNGEKKWNPLEFWFFLKKKKKRKKEKRNPLERKKQNGTEIHLWWDPPDPDPIGAALLLRLNPRRRRLQFRLRPRAKRTVQASQTTITTTTTTTTTTWPLRYNGV